MASPVKSRRVLVTGGAGFIGSHMVDALIEQGFSVVVLDNLSTGKREQIAKAATFITGDVRDEAAVAHAFEAGIDIVFHIAGQASITLSYADPSCDLNVNTLGTVNVLKQCLAHRVRRLLFASSMTIYGNPAVVPTPESAFPDPVSFYGITKYAAERYVHLTGRRTDLDAALDVTSFRMFNVYGPRQLLDNPYQGVLAIFLGRLLRGEQICIHADGEQSRDFVHVKDVCRAWLGCIDRPESYDRVFNVGSSSPTTVNRLCDIVLEHFGHTRSSYSVGHAGAQQGDIRVSAADIAALCETTGWRPEISMEQGLAETVEWAMHHRLQGDTDSQGKWACDTSLS